MRTSLLLMAAMGVVLLGCGEKSDKPVQPTNATASGGSVGGVLSAPADYVGAVVKAQQTAVITIDTASLTKSIQLFNVQEGRYPKSLGELVEMKYLPQLPTPPFGTKLEYNAASGEVKVVKQ